MSIPTIKEFGFYNYLRVGISATITNNRPIATAALTSIVATFGAPAVAVIITKVESLVLIAPSALSSGLSPFVGRIGGHFEERVAEGFISILYRLGIVDYGDLLIAPRLEVCFRMMQWYKRTLPLSACCSNRICSIARDDDGKLLL